MEKRAGQFRAEQGRDTTIGHALRHNPKVKWYVYSLFMQQKLINIKFTKNFVKLISRKLSRACPRAYPIHGNYINMHTIRCLRNIGVMRPHHYMLSSPVGWRGALWLSSRAAPWSSFWSIWPFSSSEATSTSIPADLEQQQEQHRL